jgi:hypothetical protein
VAQAKLFDPGSDKPFPLNCSKVELFLQEICAVLAAPEPPEPDAECEYCEYVTRAGRGRQ